MKLLILSLCVALAGCATSNAEYYDAIKADRQAVTARWNAMAAIAETGDVTAKAVALAVMGNAASTSQPIAAPRTAVDQILQAAGILVPAIVQGYGIRQQTQLGAIQSNNAAAVAQSTNAAFVGIAGQIQTAPAPQANVSNVTTYANTTTTTTDSHAVANSYNPTSTDNSNQGNAPSLPKE